MEKKGFTLVCNSCGKEAMLNREVHRMSYPIHITLIGDADCGLICTQCNNNIVLQDKTVQQQQIPLSAKGEGSHGNHETIG